MLDGSDLDFIYDEDSSLSDSSLAAADPAAFLPEPIMLPEKSANLLSKFSYRAMTLAQYISTHYLAKATHLHDTILPHVPIEDLLVMLHYKKWLVDEVTGDYYNDWPRLRRSCGLPEKPTEHTVTAAVDFVCPICCDEGNLDVFSLLCGHSYCAQCYRRYVEAAIPAGQLVRCMDPQCNMTLYPRDIVALLKVEIESTLEDARRAQHAPASEPSSDGEDSVDDQHDHEYNLNFDFDFTNNSLEPSVADPMLRHPLLVAAARAEIDLRHDKYRWCPAVDCSMLVELLHDERSELFDRTTNLNLDLVPIVTCPASDEFCFDCQYENHLPCPCWLVAKWIKRCEDDSETANWIEANTQACPKCQAQIEKNGGCNHMSCRKCHQDFCWICLGDWAAHKEQNWQCNRYNPEEVAEVKKRRSRHQQSLNRYLHFYKRYSVHQISMEGDKKTLLVVHRCMLEYMKVQARSKERNISWNDVQFLSDAIHSLSSGRKTLMWTYAFAFQLEATNYAQIFEQMQDYLNKTVEDLSSLFEQITVAKTAELTAKMITSRKAEIVDLAALVTRRKFKLINCADNGIQRGWLQFA